MPSAHSPSLPALSPEAIRIEDLEDGERFTCLFERVKPILRPMLRRWLSPCLRSKEDTSDLLQDTYISALAARAQFRGTTWPMFVSWLQVIARRRARATYRHYVTAEKRDVRRELFATAPASDASDTPRGFPATHPSGVLGEIGRREGVGLVCEHLRALPNVYRAIVEMHYLNGLSLRQIAGKVGRTRGAIAMLLRRALDRLRRIARD